MKKIALLIGNNYTNSNYKLFGCQNDIIKYKQILLNKFGYKEENIKMLMDLTGYEYPTGSNIIKYMNWINQETYISKNVDEITFYYSGHGTNIRDINGDEKDGMDECIVPYDFEKIGVITDDYIYLNFLGKLKSFNRMICIFDSCNSASCTDLPYSFTCMNNILVKQFYSKRPTLLNNPNIFVLSGCLDAKTSLDSREPDGTPCGLLSYWLRMTLEKYNYSCTINNLIIDIKKGFGNNDQTPVLSVNSNNFVPNTLVFRNIKPPTKTSTKTPTIAPTNNPIKVTTKSLKQDKEDKKKDKKKDKKRDKKKDDLKLIFNIIGKMLS
jgi:hypothetical protein